jgi:hypothetical protein
MPPAQRTASDRDEARSREGLGRRNSRVKITGLNFENPTVTAVDFGKVPAKLHGHLAHLTHGGLTAGRRRGARRSDRHHLCRHEREQEAAGGLPKRRDPALDLGSGASV